MKRILLALTVITTACLQAFSQCPDASVTGDGFHPPSDSLECVERGQTYDESIQVNLPSSFSTPLGNITVTSLVIDNVAGLPNGITSTCTPSNCTFAGGTQSCINFTGTTNDPAGLYKLNFIVTISVDVPLLGAQSFGPADIDSIIAQIEGFGVSVPFLEDIEYYLNVIEQGAPCVKPVSVTIEGETEICPGDQTTLEAVVENASGNETFLWSTGDTGPQIVVSDTGTYSVEVFDSGDTVSASVTVTFGLPPVAGFAFFTSSLRAIFLDSTQGSNVTYAWDFGDGQTSADQNPFVDYANAGTYTVTLTATSSCGDDTASQQVTVAVGPCTANQPSGTPGVFPDPDAIPCIERNQPYDFTMQIENFDTLASILGFGIIMDSTRIDSIANFPCGINWEADKLFYRPGETGCINVSGTSKEVIGQYPLKMYMTLWVEVPFLGPQVFSGDLNDLLSQLNGLLGGFGVPTLDFDFKYVSRVIEDGETVCPPRDTATTANASGTVCPAYRVDIAGNTLICTGQSLTLEAEAKYYDGAMADITYAWSSGATTKDISVTQAGTYSVTVSDVNGATATDDITVTEGSAPTAGFTASVAGATATIDQNSTTGGATSYSWNWGDGTTPSTGQIPPPHTYTTNNTFTITLTATNSCGSTTFTQDVTTTGVFIKPVQNNIEFEVYPNPSTGSFNLSLTNNTTKEVTLRIFDLSGKMVYSEPIREVNSVVKRQINLSSLPKGVYSLHLSSEAGNGIQRITIY